MNAQPQPQPPKTDPDDMSRPGPITFLILAAIAGVYVFFAYRDQVLTFLGIL